MPRPISVFSTMHNSLFSRGWIGGIVFLLGMSLVAGCGGSDGPQRVILSGTVTYQGQPVKEGQICFLPIEGTQAPVAGAPITDGKYCVEQKGGLPVGTHKVQILAFASNGKGGADAMTGLMGKQYLPWKYNRETELKITVESGSDAITQDYNLAK